MLLLHSRGIAQIRYIYCQRHTLAIMFEFLNVYILNSDPGTQSVRYECSIFANTAGDTRNELRNVSVAAVSALLTITRAAFTVEIFLLFNRAIKY